MCSNVAFGIILLTVYGCLKVSSQQECISSAATLRVQNSCKQEDEDLMYAHINKDVLDICRKMAIMLKCAVSSLPHCYDYFETSTFNMYFHSPYSCELSQQLIIELQDIYNMVTDPDVLHVSTSSPITEASTYVSTPTTTVIEDEAETTPTSLSSTSQVTQQQRVRNITESEDSSRIAVNNQNDARGGWNEKQQGEEYDNSASLAVLRMSSLLLLVVMSRLLSWRLTS